MGNIKTAKLLAAIITISGLIVMTGWFLEIEVLKSILPVWVSMKFLTAFSFFLSGLILFFVKTILENKSDIGQIMLTASTLIIMLVMTTFLLSTFLSIRTGIEDMFVREAESAVKTVTPGRPSIGTMLNFILVALSGILTLYEIKKLKTIIYTIGLIIMVIAGVALLGYILSMPVLYYSFEDYSSAMAVHTSILFLLLGIGFVSIGKKRTNK